VEQGLITQKLLDACDAFVFKWPSAPFGPAHIVIDDQNADDESIQWCLDHWDEYAGDEDERARRADEYAATKAFLSDLLTWPTDERIGPEECD
jgi:hypothetical protein